MSYGKLFKQFYSRREKIIGLTSGTGEFGGTVLARSKSDSVEGVGSWTLLRQSTDSRGILCHSTGLLKYARARRGNPTGAMEGLGARREPEPARVAPSGCVERRRPAKSSCDEVSDDVTGMGKSGLRMEPGILPFG